MVKKSFYEILGVSPQATDADIRLAHQSKIEQLKVDEARLSHEEYEFELKILKMAFGTLTDEQARNAYDAQLAVSRQPLRGGGASSQGNPIQPMPADSLVRRADVMSLRADAMALRADAIATKLDLGDVMPLMATKQTLWSPAMKLGLLVMMAIVGFFAARMASNYFMLRQVAQIRQDTALAEEKVIIQEYYMTYGVRPASAAEARLLQAQRESEEREEREKRAAERAQQSQEETQRRFIEDARRLGDQVSAEMQRADELKAMQEQQRIENEQQRIENERRQREYEEQERIRRQQEQWDRALGR